MDGFRGWAVSKVETEWNVDETATSGVSAMPCDLDYKTLHTPRTHVKLRLDGLHRRQRWKITGPKCCKRREVVLAYATITHVAIYACLCI